MDDFRRKRVALIGAGQLAISAATAWLDSEVPRIRTVALKKRQTPPEVQQSAITAAEAKRARRAERNRKEKESDK